MHKIIHFIYKYFFAQVYGTSSKNYFFCFYILKERVWARAWELENVYWTVEFNLHQSLDLLHMVCYENRYLTWWAVSDRYPPYISVCETLAKLVCHASLLKVDDVRLKGSSLASKFCTLCDLGQKEDVRHLVLQCPIFALERESMFHDIRQLPNNLGKNEE